MRLNREGAMEEVTEDLEAMVTEAPEGREVPEGREGPGVMEGQEANTEAEREENMEEANMDLLTDKRVLKMSSTFKNKDIFKILKMYVLSALLLVNTFL